MELVREIRDWALDNYDAGGHWIVETFSDEEIAEEFKTLNEAKRYCGLKQDRYEDAYNA